jgi:putative nucleotidyltransferase with HDIG domain
VLIILFITQTISLYFINTKNKKLNKLKKLSEIDKKITSNIKIKPLLNEIMILMKKELNAEASSLYLVDEDKQELWFEVALGEKGDQVKEIRLQIGEGIAGWVAKEGKVLNIKDVNSDKRFKRDIGEKIDFKQKAMLTVPVRCKDKIIGVLQVINKIGGSYFNKEDQELLEGMSCQIAIALENAKLYKELHDLFIEVIRSLADALDARDPYTKGHSVRVSEYSVEMGKEMGLSEEKLELLEYMAILHDIGKIGIRDEILNKPGRLNDEEFCVMKSHPDVGAKILQSVNKLKSIVPGVKHHHEKFDGSGYTEGLKGKDIPLEARIVSVADTYDAMTTDRPYRKGLSHETAMKEINKTSGKQFDPDIVEIFNIIMKRKMEKTE